jgi:hypothetical protein
MNILTIREISSARHNTRNLLIIRVIAWAQTAVLIDDHNRSRVSLHINDIEMLCTVIQDDISSGSNIQVTCDFNISVKVCRRRTSGIKAGTTAAGA